MLSINLFVPSAAELRFATVEEGEAAYVAMKSQLASADVDVYHPSFREGFDYYTLKSKHAYMSNRICKAYWCDCKIEFACKASTAVR